MESNPEPSKHCEFVYPRFVFNFVQDNWKYQLISIKCHNKHWNKNLTTAKYIIYSLKYYYKNVLNIKQCQIKRLESGILK